MWTRRLTGELFSSEILGSEIWSDRGGRDSTHDTPWGLTLGMCWLSLGVVHRPQHSSIASDLEPVAAIGHPPRGKTNGDSGGAGPPERKQEIGHQPKQDEDHPEYLFLHGDDCSVGAPLYSRNALRQYRGLARRSFELAHFRFAAFGFGKQIPP